MTAFFRIIISDPLFNLLVVLYKHVTFEDLGVAIIFLTIIIRVVFYPLFYKAFKNQALMQKVQPELKKIQVEHKGNREQQAAAMMKLWQEHKINPFSSFILIFAQLIILIPLYRIFLNGFSPAALTHLYSFVSPPLHLNNTFLGLINLLKPNMIIVGLAVVAQYIQGRLSLPKPSSNSAGAPNKMGRQMLIVGPLLTLLILPSLSAAIGLYWVTSTLFSIFQQYLINQTVYGRKSSGQGQKNS